MSHQFAVRDQSGTTLRAGPAPGDKAYALPAVGSSFALAKSSVDVSYTADGELALAIDAQSGAVHLYDASTGSTMCALPTKGAAAVDTSDYECVGLANARHRPAGEAPPRPTYPSAALPAPTLPPTPGTPRSTRCTARTRRPCATSRRASAARTARGNATTVAASMRRRIIGRSPLEVSKGAFRPATTRREPPISCRRTSR